MLAAESESSLLYPITCAIAWQHIPAATAALLRVKSHPSSQVRLAVAQAFGRHDTHEMVAALIDLSADEDEDVRDWATTGLGTMTDLDTPELRAALAAR